MELVIGELILMVDHQLTQLNFNQYGFVLPLDNFEVGLSKFFVEGGVLVFHQVTDRHISDLSGFRLDFFVDEYLWTDDLVFWVHQGEETDVSGLQFNHLFSYVHLFAQNVCFGSFHVFGPSYVNFFNFQDPIQVKCLHNLVILLKTERSTNWLHNLNVWRGYQLESSFDLSQLIENGVEVQIKL